MKNQVELQQSFDFAGISDFVAGFLLTLGTSRMLENPQLYGPVTVSWRNYHLSSGQYLPIMLQAWGRCSNIISPEGQFPARVSFFPSPASKFKDPGPMTEELAH